MIDLCIVILHYFIINYFNQVLNTLDGVKATSIYVLTYEFKKNKINLDISTMR